MSAAAVIVARTPLEDPPTQPRVPPVSAAAQTTPSPRGMPAEVFVDLATDIPPVVPIEPATDGFSLHFRNATARGAYRVTIESEHGPGQPYELRSEAEVVVSYKWPPPCEPLKREALRLLDIDSEGAVAVARESFRASARAAEACREAEFFRTLVERAIDRGPGHGLSSMGGEEFVVRVERLDTIAAGGVLRSWKTRLVVRDPDAHWRVPNEEAWLVEQTARHVVALCAGAVGGADSVEVKVQVKPRDTTPRYEVRVGPGNEPVVVALAPYVWSPGAWAGLARQRLGQRGGDKRRADAQADAEAVAALLDFRAVNVAAAARSASSRLAEAPASAAAHEAAALALGAFALRESAGEFSEIRPTLGRLAAHLAVARALAKERSQSGRLAELTLLVLAGRQAEADVGLERAQATATPAVKAWARALALRNRGDWRLVPRPGNASLLERIELFRALTPALGALRATQVVRPETAEVADWGRVAIDAGTTVEEGHAFVSNAGAAELAEARAVFRAVGQGELSPEGYVAALNESPNPRRRPEDVLSWGDWAEFLRRHLLAAADANAEFLSQVLYWKEEGDAFSTALERQLGGLRGFMFLKRRSDERQRAQGGELSQNWPAFCAGASRLAAAQPELLSPSLWFEASYRCKPPGARVANPAPWFTPAIPYGTAFDLTARWPFVRRGAAGSERLQAALAVAPHKGEVVAAVLKAVDSLQPAEAARMVQPLLDYSPGVVSRYLEYLEKRGLDAERRQLSMRLCELVPEGCSQAAVAHMAAGDVDLAARAYRRWFDDGASLVEASARASWLVDYYMDRGRTKDALDIATRAAATGSGGGLEAIAQFAERSGRLDAAEQVLRQIEQRYDNDEPLLAFYIRHRDKPAYAAAGARALGIVFPKGLEPVTLANIRRFALDGVRFSGRSAEFAEAGVDWGSGLIVALDGLKVHNSEQYFCVRAFSADPTMRLIVYRGDDRSYREVNVRTRLPRRRVGLSIDEAGSPRQKVVAGAGAGASTTVEGKDAAHWLRALADASSPEHGQAYEALVQLGPSAIPGLVHLAESGDPPSRARALKTLAAAATRDVGQLPESARRAFANGLQSESLEVRLEAVVGLAMLSRFDPSQALLLGSVLGNADEKVRATALSQLSMLPAEVATAAMPGVVQVLRTGNDGQRLWILQNLNRLSKDVASSAAPVVLELTQTGPPLTRSAAIQCAAYAASDAPQFNEMLRKGLEDPERGVRGASINVSQMLKARSLLPSLEKVARDDPDPLLRQYAQIAIRRIQEP